jgi:hypothetical protein
MICRQIPGIHTKQSTTKTDTQMKRLIALTVLALASQAVVIFAGEPVVSSKEVVAPPPPPPPEFFRPNEFDIGAFGTYAEGVGGSGHHLHGWGGGMDFTYWFPWKYAGIRFQGAGLDISGGGGPRSRTFTFPDGETATVSGGGGSVAGGVVTGDFLLRLPLDAYWPNIHLAPYFFAGFGAIIVGSPGNGNHEFVERTVFVSRTQGAPANQPVNLTGRVISRLQQDFPGGSQVLGHVGGGLEYRFTPNIAIFGELGYDFPNLANNNFIQTNFGLRYAF